MTNNIVLLLPPALLYKIRVVHEGIIGYLSNEYITKACEAPYLWQPLIAVFGDPSQGNLK